MRMSELNHWRRDCLLVYSGTLWCFIQTFMRDAHNTKDYYRTTDERRKKQKSDFCFSFSFSWFCVWIFGICGLNGYSCTCTIWCMTKAIWSIKQKMKLKVKKWISLLYLLLAYDDAKVNSLNEFFLLCIPSWKINAYCPEFIQFCPVWNSVEYSRS